MNMRVLSVPYVSRQKSIDTTLEVMVDDDIYNLIKDTKILVSCTSYPGDISKSRYYFRLASKGFYNQVGNKGRYVYLHRFVISCPNNLVADHIDGNTLNCTRDNLRSVTASQNAANIHGGTVYGIVKTSTGYNVKSYKGELEYIVRGIRSYPEAELIQKALKTFIHGI